MMLDSHGRLKLADFGLSRTVSDSMSRLSNLEHTGGTVSYMSPQQADGRKPQIIDDVYSLGATLYELLTSSPPFHSGDIAYQLRHVTPDALEQRLADLELTNEIPAPIAAMILACLAKEPEQRPQSAKAILDWLDYGQGSVARTVDEPAPSRESLAARPTEVMAVPEPGAPPSDDFLTTTPVGLEERPHAPQFGIDQDKTDGWPETLERHGPPPYRARLAWLALALLLAGGASAMSWYFAKKSLSNKAVPVVEAGFESLFNGRDLTGWDGDTNLW